ncbi:ATP-binding cassette domain-containing protein [Lacihabitans sp. LS3-19]|uniref:ABC transporter ATP-binding protein n=1 Tax=Lacihabitans sp. LS3-19 TaxID=2487335 RepID=UPI0020CE6594|nr:ATP-binding cassette domain-containing protein [Lacihabitans sp. LS3-19]MCP9766902.1 ATP-binding cassette domain-containing protein [Lacihabitans sp. LS3-19]
MLEVKNYLKKYNQHLVLDIPELSIVEGIHWFVGKNGSGKSTFFKSLAGITPFEGKMLFRGLLPSQKECKFLVNYSEAEPKYPDFVSGKDILKFIAYAKKASVRQMEELAEHFGINEYWEQKIGSYSSGMLKKITLVSGFLGNPTLIILDEPFILIDAASIEKLYNKISELRESHNVNFFLSSHQDLVPSKLHVDGLYFVDNKIIVKK